MNKAASIGIVVSAIIIGILVVLSLDSFSIVEDDGLSSEPILGSEGENTENEPNPPGRDLSIEFEENMGLSTP